MKYLLTFILALILTGSLWGSWYLWQKSQNSPENILKNIEKMVEIPDEPATLATVVDKSKLRDELFFKNAKNGDRVVLFPNAGKAFLYRPLTRKIIEITTLSKTQAPSSGIPTFVIQKSKVVVLNGSGKPDIASYFENKISQKITNIEVVYKNSTGGLYSKSSIIDLSRKNKTVVQKLSKVLEIQLADKLPEKEQSESEGIVIIVGQDFIK